MEGNRKRYRVVFTEAPSDLGMVDQEFSAFWTHGVQVQSATFEVVAEDGFAEAFEEEAHLEAFHVEEVAE